MKRRLVNGDDVEPNDMAIIVGQLGMVVIVSPGVMGLEMSMNRRVRVIGIGFVHVLRRDRRRKRDERHQNQAYGGPPE